jgi:hypothetical protein
MPQNPREQIRECFWHADNFECQAESAIGFSLSASAVLHRHAAFWQCLARSYEFSGRLDFLSMIDAKAKMHAGYLKTSQAIRRLSLVPFSPILHFAHVGT